ncbi:MAG: tetratricopeptide repeat protein [Gammaproteobacteria bacterium]|nr:tetratricopeptide repeat protein [Gammaproteobacteria bacterium]
MVIVGNRRLVAALAALVLSGCAEQTSESTIPNIPTVETRGMEAPVRILIDAVARNLEGDRHSAIAWGRLGRVYHAHELYTPALVCYEQAIRLDRDDYQWPYLAAHAASQVDKDAAVALFEQARKRAPRHATVLVAQGELLRQLGRSDDARDAFLAALEADDRSSFARVGLARVALVEGDLPRARSLLERAAELTPTDGSIYPLLTRVHARLGESDLAVRAEWLAKVHDTPLAPRDPALDAMRGLAANSHALASAGTALAARGELRAAEAQFRKVLSIRPGTPQDLGNLATVLSRQGRHAEAMEFFARGLAGSPDDIVLLSHQGLTQMMIGDVEAAEASLKRAATLDPSYPQGQFNLGTLRFGQGRHRDAIALFQRTLALDPGLTDAYLNLGSAHAAVEEFEAALEPWKRLREIQPDNASLIHNIALANARLGRLDTAIAEFQRAIQLDPDSPASRRELARARARQRQD